MRIWAIAVLAVVLFGCPWTVIADQFGDFEYTSHGESVTITDYTGSGGDVVIPDTIAGLPVTVIGQTAFAFEGGVTSVAMPVTVTTIGNGAFQYCSSLTSMNIPHGVQSIGSGAFASCLKLESINVDDGNTSYRDIDGVLFTIAQDTLIQFPGGKGGDYDVPESVGVISPGAFRDAGNLTTVNIPRGVSEIWNSAFSGCGSLTEIAVSDMNESYSSVDGVLFDKSRSLLIQYPGGKTGDYSVPEGVSTVGWRAFYDCDGLIHVVLPPGLQEVGVLAFSQCDNLISVRIPDSVDVIGFSAFSDCPMLSDFSVPKGVTWIMTETFSGCHSLLEIAIPNGVTNVWFGAFANCDSLTKVTVGSQLSVIYGSAFAGCEGLESVFFTGDAPIYGPQVFNNSDNVTVYYLPGTTGWGDTFAERPAMLWNPVISDPTPGVGESSFSFQITGTEDIPISVEATDDLIAGAWTLLGTNTLGGGSVEFEDEVGVNFGNRVYRIAAP